MTLVAGSYERFLFGYSYPQPSQDSPKLVRRFTHAAHKGVVKCLASAGQYVASGGADDLIHLYDLKNDKDLGFLMNPGEGAVTALEFFVPKGAFNPTHLLSGSADGTMSVWSVGGGWECMKTLRGHRKAVNAITVHSSGAIALSSSRDGTLRMWDLVKGRSTFTTKLEAEAEGVQFSPSGATYALLCGTRVTLHAIGGQQGVVGELPHPRRALCMAYSPGGSFLATGAEDGSLRVWDTQTSQEVLCIPRAHSTRIRGLALPHSPSSTPSTPGLPPLVATASSDGVIKLWDLTAAQLAPAGAISAGVQGASCLVEAATSARLTTLCALPPPEVMAERLKESQKRKAGKEGGEKAKAAAAGSSAVPAAAKQAQREGGPAKKRKQAAAVGGASEEQQPPLKKPAALQQQQGTQEKKEGRAKKAKPGGPAAAGRVQLQVGAADADVAAAGAAGPSGSRGPSAGGAGPKQQSAAGTARVAGVSKGGVVDFMDAKDWQRAQQKKKKQKKKQQQAGEQGAAAGARRQQKGKGGSKYKK